MKYSQTQSFDEMFLETTSSSAWLPILQYRKVLGGLSNQNVGSNILITPSNTFFIGTFEYKGLQFKARLEGRVLYPKEYQNTRQWNIIFITYLIFQSQGNITDTIAVELSREFSKLLSIILGPVQEIKSLNLMKENECQSLFPKLTEYPNLIKYKNMEDYIFSFKSFSSSWNKVLNTWFNKSIKMKMLVDNYLLTIAPYTTVENNLVNLCQGIDSFYPDGYLIDKIEKTVNSLPNNIKDVLKKNNRFILNNYYKKIALEDYLNRNNINADDYIAIWSGMIKDTRVYLIHGNEDKKLRIDNSNDLKRATKLLSFLVECFILQELGYKELNRQEVTDYLKGLINPLPF